jgi:hypothetical protein
MAQRKDLEQSEGGHVTLTNPAEISAGDQLANRTPPSPTLGDTTALPLKFHREAG